MRERLHRIWIPGIVVGVVFWLSQSALMRLRSPQIIPFHGTFFAFDWAWIPLAILSGACISTWSRTNGGTVRDRITATLLPMGALMAFFVVITPIAMGFDHPRSISSMLFSVLILVSWLIVMPAACMLMGAAPFLRGAAKPATEPQQAS